MVSWLTEEGDTVKDVYSGKICCVNDPSDMIPSSSSSSSIELVLDKSHGRRGIFKFEERVAK